MQNLGNPALRFRPFPDARWEPADKPVLIVDGELHRVRQLNERISGHAAFVVGAGQSEIAVLSKLLDVKHLYFYELRANNLAPLGPMLRLRHLKIHWNTKLTSLETLSNLRQLETLILEDTPKTKDLAPLTLLADLAAFQPKNGS